MNALPPSIPQRLDAESSQAWWQEYLKEFRQSGIQLDDAGQERLRVPSTRNSRDWEPTLDSASKKP
jgi:Zn-dependent oligopeptidase